MKRIPDALVSNDIATVEALVSSEPPPTGKLSRSDLEALLKKAITRDAAGGDAFSREDLLAAGRELGVSEAALVGVYQEHLARNERQARSPREALVRPFDTRIELAATADALMLEVPAAGLRLRHAPMLLFSVVWLSFSAYWTSGAAKVAGGTFALFSVVHWAAGFGLLLGTLGSAYQRARLRLSGSRGRLERRFGRGVDLRVDQLRVREGSKERRHKGGHVHVTRFVALEHGTKTYELLREHSDAERRWVTAELGRWLEDQRG